MTEIELLIDKASRVRRLAQRCSTGSVRQMLIDYAQECERAACELAARRQMTQH